MADVLCDASSLISFTRSCFSNVLSFMHNTQGVRFFISPAVEKEIITRPLSLKTRQYALSAMRLKDLMRKKIILKIDADVLEKAKEYLKITNNLFFVKGRGMNIIHLGETEIIALADHQGINNILIDERTTRMLIESPFIYKKHLEDEFKVTVMLNKQNLSLFRNITKNLKIIRSSELLTVAYENGLMDGLKELKRDTLSAGLFSLKYSGCAIRFDEITRLMGKIR